MAYQSTLLGLREPQEDHDQGDNIETCVEAESTNRMHRMKHGREGDGQDCSPEQAGGYSPGHANLTMAQGEDLGRVGEGNRAFAGGIEGGEL